MYSEQLEQKRIRKETEKIRLTDEAKSEAKSLQRQLDQTRSDAAKVKQEERERYQQMQLTSKENEEFKMRKKEQDAQLDQKLMNDYKLKLERDDAMKKKALNDRMSKYESIGNQWATTGAGAQKAAQEKEIMRIVTRDAKLKEDRDDARNKADKDKLVKDKILMRDLNNKLIEEKRDRIRAEHERDAAFAKRAKEDNDSLIQAEKDKMARKKNAALEYKEQLVKQKIVQKEMEKNQQVGVSETERAMNKSAFDKLRTDVELVDKIRSKYMHVPTKPLMSLSDRLNGGGGGGGGRGGSPNKRRKKVKRTRNH